MSEHEQQKGKLSGSKQHARRRFLAGLGGGVGLIAIAGGYFWWSETRDLSFEIQGPDNVGGVHWSPDSSQLLLATSDSLVFWDVAAGKQRLQLPYDDYVYHRDPQTSATYVGGIDRAVFSPRGRYLAISTFSRRMQDDGSLSYTDYRSRLVVCDSATGKHLFLDQHFPLVIVGIAWSPDESQLALAVAARDNLDNPYPTTVEVQIWDYTHNQQVTKWPVDLPPLNQKGPLWTAEMVAWSPDGVFVVRNEWLISELLCWKVATHELVSTYNAPEPILYTNTRALLKMSADGKRMALADSSSAKIYLWDAASGSNLQILKLEKVVGLQEIIWSSDGRYIAASVIATGGSDYIYIIDVASGQIVLTRETGSYSLTWSPDGKYLAYVDREKAQVWPPRL